MKITHNPSKIWFTANPNLEGKRVASYADGFWQGLSIGLGVAFFGMPAEFIVMIS